MAFILRNARSKIPFVAVPYSMGLIDRATAAEQALADAKNMIEGLQNQVDVRIPNMYIR